MHEGSHARAHDGAHTISPGRYTKARSDAMAPFQPPEMLRVPLHELCLQVMTADDL